MIDKILCLAVILRSEFENGRDPRGHPLGSPLDLFKPWSFSLRGSGGRSSITCIVIRASLGCASFRGVSA